jgi:cation transport ATPase
MKFLEDEMKLTSSNPGDSPDSRPGFSLLLNKKHHHYLTDAHLNGQTLQESSSIDMLYSSTTAFVSLDRQIIGAVLLEDKLRQETKEAIAKIKVYVIFRQPIILLLGIGFYLHTV